MGHVHVYICYQELTRLTTTTAHSTKIHLSCKQPAPALPRTAAAAAAVQWSPVGAHVSAPVSAPVSASVSTPVSVPVGVSVSAQEGVAAGVATDVAAGAGGPVVAAVRVDAPPPPAAAPSLVTCAVCQLPTRGLHGCLSRLVGTAPTTSLGQRLQKPHPAPRTFAAALARLGRLPWPLGLL